MRDDDLVHDPVLLGLLGGHEEVAVRVLRDALHRLAGVRHQDLVQLVADAQDLPRLDVDVRRLALHARQGLVDHDPRMGQGEALALGARAQQQRPHRRGLAHADRRDGRLDVLHGVVDRHPRRHRPARAVHVEVDVLLRVLGLQEEHLGDDQVGHVVFDVARQEDDALLEEPREDVVRALAARRLLHDHGNECHSASYPGPTLAGRFIRLPWRPCRRWRRLRPRRPAPPSRAR